MGGRMNDLSGMPAEARLPEEKHQPSLVCPRDGKAMTLARVDPKLGALPELRTFRCEQCGAVETVEVRPRAAAAW